MHTPSIPQLQHMAQFDVGDHVYLNGTTVWRIAARYWSGREQCILYDLRFDRTGVVVTRIREERLSGATPKHG